MNELAITAVLSALEEVEYSQLNWGYVDAATPRELAIGIAKQSLERLGLVYEAEDVLGELIECGLVRELYVGGGYAYRTRFAEFVRISVRSRQWFSGQRWQDASPLVSDFRVDIRRRKYPRRNISSETVLEECEKVVALSKTLRRAWKELAPNDFSFSRFQADSTRRLLARGGEDGTIITAGTGSGKTLAFYFPALLTVSESLVDSSAWVRILALYPRQELLKDQLNEVFRLADRLADVLASQGKRKVSFGALYRSTPRSSDAEELLECGWFKKFDGHVSPTHLCPKCGGELLWKLSDSNSGRESLRCVLASCGFVSDPDCLRLTRMSILKSPPDFFFSTTEMLNQRLSDTFARKLFGVGVDAGKKPLFVLLDEVHTYMGVTGAQTALVLRRWRHLLRSPVRWVGLSATLRDASRFFSDLCGVRPDVTQEICPRFEEMEQEGAEYQLILKGNPSEQVSTLSVSIQVAFALSRHLDAAAHPFEHRRFGRKLFAFTDDLDVTNRLYDDLRDAEGYRLGRPDPRKTPLAGLRSSGSDRDQEAAGQIWRLAEYIRKSLTEKLIVGRTSSRDTGVERLADVVVATSALEVGFNDPEVGAILQHKAPRSFASYLQRRGRAGRSRWMRPITVTVLSDYGRDRMAFQSHELLFDPEIEAQTLPVRNLYVLRIQAIYALFDWLASEVAADGGGGWAWDALSRPGSRQKEFVQTSKKWISKLVQLDEEAIRRYREYIKGCLQLDDRTADAVLWEPPRSVLLEAIPTLARRIYQDWKLAGRDGHDLYVEFHPLPDFVPRSLFNELNLPEVIFMVPPAWNDGQIKPESMPIAQGLRQFAPGRVRRRFADDRSDQSHWFPLVASGGNCSISIASYATEREYVGTFPGVVDGEVRNVAVFRPWRVKLEKPPSDVLAQSNSSWVWQSNFDVCGEPRLIEAPRSLVWSQVFPRLHGHLHRFGGAFTIRRFACGGVASIKKRKGDVDVAFSLIDDVSNEGEVRPAAVGYEFDADALELPVSSQLRELISKVDIPESSRRSLVALRLRCSIAEDGELPSDLNEFQRDWLYQAVLLSIARLRIRDGLSISAALDNIGSTGGAEFFASSLSLLVGGSIDRDDGGDETRLEKTLREVVERPGVLARILELARQSLSKFEVGLDKWLHTLAINSLAEAVLDGCLLATPRESIVESLTVDVRCDAQGESSIVVAETALGGGGAMDSLVQAISAEPVKFFTALDAALLPSDVEAASSSLERVYELLEKDDELADLLEQVRQSSMVGVAGEVRERFMLRLERLGVLGGHALSVAIATRLLRPGCGAQEDRVTTFLVRRWSSLEADLGFVLPMRVAANALLCDGDVLSAIAGFSTGGSERTLVSQLLFPRDVEIRQHLSQSYNPFVVRKYNDMEFVRHLFGGQKIPRVQVDLPEWFGEFETAVSQFGKVALWTSSVEATGLARVLVEVATRPVMFGSLLLYGALERCVREVDGTWVATVVLREGG